MNICGLMAGKLATGIVIIVHHTMVIAMVDGIMAMDIKMDANAMAMAEPPEELSEIKGIRNPLHKQWGFWL